MSKTTLKILLVSCFAILTVGFSFYAFFPATIIYHERLSLFLRADRTLSILPDEAPNTNEPEIEKVVPQSDFPFKTELIGAGHMVKVSWRNRKGKTFSEYTDYDIDNLPTVTDFGSWTNDFSIKLKYKLPLEAVDVLVEDRWDWKRFLLIHGKMVILPGIYFSEVSKSDWVPVSSLKPYSVSKGYSRLEIKPCSFAPPPMSFEPYSPAISSQPQLPSCCGSIPHKSPCLGNLR